MINKDWNFCYQILQAVAMLKVSIFMFFQFQFFFFLKHFPLQWSTRLWLSNNTKITESSWKCKNLQRLEKHTNPVPEFLSHKQTNWRWSQRRSVTHYKGQSIEEWTKGYGLRKQTLEYSWTLCRIYLTENFHLMFSQYIAV